MMEQAIWWLGIATELLILVRSFKTRLIGKLPTFYLYIASILFIDLLSVIWYRFFAHSYSAFYWSTEFLLASVGYAVIMEIYQFSFKPFPGVEKLARFVLLSIFVLVIAKVCLDLLARTTFPLVRGIAEMEIYLRFTQAGLLISILFLLLYYRIPVGRNLKGLILGYTFFIGSNVIAFTFISHPASGLANLMREAEPTFYLISLAIWLISLWSRQPEAAVDRGSEIEQDYEVLVREARVIFQRAKTQLLKVVRS